VSTLCHPEELCDEDVLLRTLSEKSRVHNGGVYVDVHEIFPPSGRLNDNLVWLYPKIN
jgi:hypothetical protein